MPETKDNPRNRLLSCVPEDAWGLCFTRVEKQTLRELAQSRQTADRKLCARWFWAGTLASRNLPVLLELADVLVRDPNPNVRWWILVNLGVFLEEHPEKLWPFVLKWGSVHTPDIRTGVACCLLEHLLEYHFEEYFGRSQQAILDGNKRFASTLNYCHKLGQAEEPENARRFDEFIASLRLRQWK